MKSIEIGNTPDSYVPSAARARASPLLSAFGAESAWTPGPLIRSHPPAGSQEVGCVRGPLKADQMGSEHPLDELSSPRQLRSYFVTGERDVVEGPDPHTWPTRRPDGSNCSW